MLIIVSHICDCTLKKLSSSVTKHIHIKDYKLQLLKDTNKKNN